MALSPVRRYGRQLRKIGDRFLEPVTFAVRNRAAREAFRANAPQLSGPARRVLDQLSREGLAHAHYSELVPADAWLPLEQAIRTWIASPEHAREVEAAHRLDGRRAGGKSYQLNRTPVRGALPFDDPLVRFGVRRELLQIINTYLGLLSRLLGANGWHTIPIPEATARRQSQRWHRDPEDRRLVKVFAYFTDVNAGTGAMEYVRYSRPGEKYWRHYPRRTPHGVYPPDRFVEDHVPEADRVTCSFPAGTMVFADTVGFHRGGWATKGDRILANWIYTSQATWWDRWFRVVNAPPPESVPVEERFALLTG
jgi:hypothetical protein